MRIVKVFWGLDSSLAYKRHFPAINWLNSYSLYYDKLSDYYAQNGYSNRKTQSSQALKLLQIENELDEIVKLVGIDAISSEDRIVMETARSIREDYLQQNAMSEEDSYSSLEKQNAILDLVMTYYKKTSDALAAGADLDKLIEMPVRDRIAHLKDVVEQDVAAAYEEIKAQLDIETENILKTMEADE